MKAVIMAGGLGTRMGATGIPKPMLPVAGKPVLERQIECLVRFGITDITIVTHHLGEKIARHFGDGSRFGARVSYFKERTPLGTAGALFKMKHDGDFLLINGDIVFDIDIDFFISCHNRRRGLATILTHPSTHPFDSALVKTDKDGRVTEWLPKTRPPSDYQNLANTGIHIISPELVESADIRGAANLDKDLLIPAVKTGRVFSCRTFEYVRDMGTPERLAQVTRDVISRLPEKKRASSKRPAVFLDRDGTINAYKGYICSPDQIELIEGAARAVKIINRLGYLAVAVTNQPVVARGMCGFDELDAIHKRLETLLGGHGAYLDGIYFCPHHPDGGYEGEVAALKCDCLCRKPKPGMILDAARDLNISLADSYMVGDSPSDILCGRAAGCKTAFLQCGSKSDPPEGAPVFRDLISFAESLKSHGGSI